MELYVNPQITGFRQDVNGDIKMLKIGQKKEDAWANIAEQGASAKLDNNKTKTIDVSTYTDPVEVLPTSGKDGMKKATITLSNIPSPSGAGTLYCWKGAADYCYTTTLTPTTSDKVIASGDNTTLIRKETITSVSEEGITISPTGDEVYERDATGDISLT
jgi:hypothetical protein